MSLRKEMWTIDYYMRKQDGSVERVTEPFPCKAGYHQRFLENSINSEGGNPITAVHGNYIQMSSVCTEEEGRHLPLEKRMDLAGAVVLVSQTHPVTITAPNGIKYIRQIP